jgi:hypothetical protein
VSGGRSVPRRTGLANGGGASIVGQSSDLTRLKAEWRRPLPAGGRAGSVIRPWRDRQRDGRQSGSPGRHPAAADAACKGDGGRIRNAIKWTRRSCRTFAANSVRLQLHALAYNLGNFVRTLATPKAAEPWSLTSQREKLIKIGAKVVSHGRYVTFQMAKVAVSRRRFADILALLRAPPASA